MKYYARRITTGYFRIVMGSRRQWGIGLILTTLAVPIMSASAAHAMTGAISQSYETTTTNITQGALLSLASNGSDVVKPADSAGNAANLAGIAASNPLVELSNGSRNSIQVVVGGSTEALVSDINGPVKVGDKITVSPVSGISMKATASSEIVGVAQGNLSSVQTVTKSFAGSNGSPQTARVGLLPISVDVAYYSAASSGGTVSAFVPSALQNLANAITGEAVSPLRVLIGTVSLLLGFTTIAIMLYVGIRSNIISLGRNPLAANALRRGMIDVFLTAVGVLVLTGVIVAAVVSA